MNTDEKAVAAISDTLRAEGMGAVYYGSIARLALDILAGLEARGIRLFEAAPGEEPARHWEPT